MTTRHDQIQPPAKQPCGSCPYRTDVPSGIWDASEYAKLPPYDADTAHQPHHLFLCHQINGRICGGWAACHDMTQSLGVRIAAISGDITPEVAEALTNYSTPIPVFPTGQAAADHGLTDQNHPSRAARRIIDKLTTRKERQR
jgi:hypothetical protein